MSDFESKLSEVLSSPEALEQILGMAKTLMTERDSGTASPETADFAPPSSGIASVLSMLGDTQQGGDSAHLDPKLISTALNLFSEYSADDDKIKLLRALKPHLKNDRAGKIDRAVQIMRISKSVRSAMNGLNGRKAGDPENV